MTTRCKRRDELEDEIKLLKRECILNIDTIQELKKQTVKYRFDSLTMLKGRIDFEDDFTSMFNKGEQFYLIIADINGLKNANIKGYENGDFLILKCVKDLIGCNPCGDKHLYRYGGDEFVILFPFNRGFNSRNFNCPSDEFTIASKASDDFNSSVEMFKSCNELLLKRKAEFYKKNPNNRRET